MTIRYFFCAATKQHVSDFTPESATTSIQAPAGYRFRFGRAPMDLIRYRVIRIGVLFVWGVLFLLAAVPAWSDAASGVSAAGKGPVPAKLGLTGTGELQISKTDRCPVCGMFPARRPTYAAAMVLKDGRTFYFCSNGCLLRTWHLTATHLGVSAESVAHMAVHDYFSGAVIDAHDAWWVAGSNAVGPMGRAFVALRTSGAADAFKERHGGEHTFKLEQLDERLFKAIFSIQ